MTRKQVHLSGNNPVCTELRKGSFEDLFKIKYKSPWGKFGRAGKPALRNDLEDERI